MNDNGQHPKRAVLYARVSGDDRGKDGRNLDGQLDMCRAYATERGWRVAAELAEDDRGASGAAFDLPELTTALDMAAKGEYDVFVTREVDRLARGLAKQLIIEQELKQSGVTIEYVLGAYDDTPEGALMKNVRAVIAEYERLKIAERTARARRQKVRKGHVVLNGGLTPFGYRAEEVDGDTVLKIDDGEAPVVRRIFNRYTDPDRPSIGAITDELSADGVPTPRDRGSYPDDGRRRTDAGEWSRGTVAHMLQNETYAGVWHYGKNGSRDTDGLPSVDVPAIVERSQWETAQKRRAVNARRAKRNTKHEYLLRGRVECGKCGAPAYGRMSKVRGKTYLYYHCAAGWKRKYDYDCDVPFFNAGDVDATAWAWAKSIILDEEGFREAVEEYRRQRDETGHPLQRRLDATDALLEAKQGKLDALLDLYLDGRYDKDELVERRQRLEGELASLREKRAEIVSDMEGQYLSDEALDDLLALVDELALGFDEADEDFETRQRLIDALGMTGELVLGQSENGQGGEKKVALECRFGAKALLTASNVTHCPRA